MSRSTLLTRLAVVVSILAAWAVLEAVGALAASGVEFPRTDAGSRAEKWLRAYGSGEGAMRAFLAENLSRTGAERRSIEDRLDVYRNMREEHGKLTLERLLDSAETSVTFLARAEHGPPLEVTVLCEGDPPHAFAGVRVTQPEPGEGPGPGVGAGGAAEAPAGPPLLDDEIARLLAVTLDSLSKADAFAGAVLLSRDGKPLIQAAYGEASREEHRANLADTKFNLGSINKIFTQVAILQLVEQGRLRPDDTIDRWVKVYPKEKGRRITIQMLLEHRAGTGDIFNAKFRAAERKRLRTTSDYVRLIADQPLEFEPGTKRAYSNAGYVLLGAVIEAASGETYYDYVRKHIFEPAEMNATASYALDEKTPNRAVGYTREGSKGLRPNADILPARGGSAGGGYSTVEDLNRFVEALRAGKLLNEKHAARYVGPGAGLGIAGGAPGVNAALEISGPYTLAVLGNLDPPAAERVASRARPWLRRGEGSAGAGSGAEAGPGVRVGAAERAGGGKKSRDPLDAPVRTAIAPGGVSVPMELVGHLPSVEVMVNGKGPYRFGFDTGGAGTARIDSALAVELGLPVVGEVWGGDPSGRNLRRLDVVGLDSITIGGITGRSGDVPVGAGLARFIGLNASVRSPREPGSHDRLDGVLGFGLFRECLLTLDYPEERLRIEEGSLPPANGSDILAYRDDDGIPSISIQVDSLNVDAHVDAGSMGGFMLPESIVDRLPLAEPPRVVGKARTVSNTFEIKAAPLKGSVHVGAEVFKDPMVEFAPIFSTANVGSRILRDYALTFDPANRRMRLKRGG